MYSLYFSLLQRIMCLSLLQFDFKSHTLSDIQQGRRAEKIEFKDVLSYQSEVCGLCYSNENWGIHILMFLRMA